MRRAPYLSGCLSHRATGAALCPALPSLCYSRPGGGVRSALNRSVGIGRRGRAQKEPLEPLVVLLQHHRFGIEQCDVVREVLELLRDAANVPLELGDVRLSQIITSIVRKKNTTMRIRSRIARDTPE